MKFEWLFDEIFNENHGWNFKYRFAKVLNDVIG